jgi:carotenoid cleavage dioxygenase
MEIVFQDIPLYQGWGKPMRAESTVEGLEVVHGHVPEGLIGTWYRGGPERQFPPRFPEDIFIDGEGMAHMFRFEAGGFVTYRSRWVRNARFLAQQQARRGLFGRYRSRHGIDPLVADVHHGTANTTMIYHSGKVMALKEDSLPHEVDPDTLETRSPVDFDGQVTSTNLTAHPKIDMVTNELLTFSYQAKGDGSRDVVFYTFDVDGRKTHEHWFQAPWSGVVHDFAITQEHVIIPFFPLITDMQAVNQGATFYQWHDHEPTWVAILPRRGSSKEVRWFKGPTTSAGHMMNAVTTGSRVDLDLCLYQGNCFPFFRTPDGRETQPVPPLLSRMSFDLAGGDGIATSVICKVPGEMPRTDDRYQGRPYHWGYMNTGRAADGSSTLSRVDVHTGAVDTWNHGQPISVHEAQFVPRAPDSPECDGWILVVLNRLDKGHSELAILDAKNLAAGPICRLHIPVRVRATFHGSWVPESTLKTGRFDMKVTG